MPKKVQHKYKKGDLVKYKLGTDSFSIEKILSKNTAFRLPHYSSETIFNLNPHGIAPGDVGVIEEEDIIGLATTWIKAKEFNKDLQHVIEENTNENK